MEIDSSEKERENKKRRYDILYIEKKKKWILKKANVLGIKVG